MIWIEQIFPQQNIFLFKLIHSYLHNHIKITLELARLANNNHPSSSIYLLPYCRIQNIRNYTGVKKWSETS